MAQSENELLKELLRRKIKAAYKRMDEQKISDEDYHYWFGVKIMAETTILYLEQPSLVIQLLKDGED